jgi:hypothetical protein
MGGGIGDPAVLKGYRIHTSLKGSAPLLPRGEGGCARARPDEGLLTREDLRQQDRVDDAFAMTQNIVVPEA